MQDLALDSYKLIKIYVYICTYIWNTSKLYILCVLIIYKIIRTHKIYCKLDVFVCFVLDRKH